MTLTRRDFIVQSSALLSTFMMPNNFNSAARYRMGLQLFTLNSILSTDVKGIMKKVAVLGYEDCETYGYDPLKNTYYGLPASDYSKILEDNQLITTSGHYDFAKYFARSDDEMARFVDQCIVGAHALGQVYITWPWLDPNSRTLDKFKALTGKLNRIGEQVKKSGLAFAYHHHDFEFTDHQGTNGYEVVMNETDAALVKLQMDLYWVMRSSKLSPAQLIAKQPGRFVMWHIKDMDKKTRDYSELGNGSIDFTKILPEASKAGLQYYYIEQGGNFEKSPMDSIATSAAYFRNNLERYLG